MGDIHMFAERRTESGWEHVPPPGRNHDWFPYRSYDLFGRLAGVRGDGPCITGEPRGIPEDASPQISDKYGPEEFRIGCSSEHGVEIR